MELRTAFGNVLRDLRVRNGMAQDELGPQAHISRMEAGKKDATLSSIENLARALGMHPVELLARAACWQADQDPVDFLLKLAAEIRCRNGELPAPIRPITSPPL
ncbi:helix-turn-helix domain-containing protein [Pseudomonas nitroreducens]|uniref:helix-turn-helix domain-containing protein n=1 Tax=Pseudomonas TaxID=286 RepID=UPI0002C4E842|nr:Cro/CI family transcriptional regulator [Pseudomonas sp. ATCC 13867]RFQ18130.1 XRE family transcriptional regulator [Pseudomonas sp. ATCC 13867]